MADIITQEDLLIVLQQSANRTMIIKTEILDQNRKIIGTLDCFAVSGNVSISGDSDIRRTANLRLQPTPKDRIKLSENSLVWLNKDIRILLGLYNIRTHSYKYYPLGEYVYIDTSSVYDASTDNITINCADFMKKLDGTKNGQLGALSIVYPAYEENKETGEVIKYNIIREAVIETLKKLAGITNYRVDDIGEYKGLSEYNPNWQKYREENETWNAIPYDQEFSCGCSVLSILTAFRDLYPNYEMFFDMDTNTFITQLRPMCYEDGLFLDNSFLQRVLISEDTSVDMTTVRNICEVWGQVLETDYYSENASYSGNIYTFSIQGYTEYHNGDKISLKIPVVNQAKAKLNINNFGVIDIYSQANDSPIAASEIKAGYVYTFQLKRKKSGNGYIYTAYILGQWQVHAINVLTNGRKSNRSILADGKEYVLYSKEYFQKFYNCDRVDMTIVPNSPFTVEKLGEILDVKTGDEYENITSDDLAADRAKWENWKNCRLTDNITITTALLPFLDVNKKVSYKRTDSDIELQYVINSISHDLAGFTTTITMYRFYPLYETLLKEAGTHKVLSDYSHGVLSKYTHNELTQIISSQEL